MKAWFGLRGKEQDKQNADPSDAEAADPNIQWGLRRAKIEEQAQAQPLRPVVSDPHSPVPEGHLRFVCISDTHSLHSFIPEMPPGDVLIHSGDFTNVGLPEDVAAFGKWLGGLPYRYKVVIAGNHDLTFDPDSYPSTWFRFRHPKKYDCAEVKAALKDCTYLEDESTEIEGIRIYGSPWQPEFFDWAFNLPRGEPCRKKWQMIPSDVDILITHGPPLGHGDLCKNGGRAGCVDLLDEVETRIKPAYHIFGHIHEGYGVTTNGQTTFVNASTVKYRYDETNLNAPIVFDVPVKRTDQEGRTSKEDDEKVAGEEEPSEE